MTITITWGWWLLPLAVQTIACIIAWWAERTSGDRTGTAGIVFYGLAIIVSLIAWLIWALVR